MFDNIRDVINSFTESERPEINDEPLLIELSACVIEMKNGRPRPNHTEQSTLDTGVCYGQGLWIYKFCSNQIKIRKPAKERQPSFLEKFIKKDLTFNKQPVYLGECPTVLR